MDATYPDLVVDLEEILPHAEGKLYGEAAVDLLNRLAEYGWQIVRLPD